MKKIEISKQQLEDWLEMGYSYQAMANEIGCSRSTVYSLLKKGQLLQKWTKYVLVD